MWNVLLVEDELFVRRALKSLIRWQDLGFRISGEAGDGEEALAIIRRSPPDVVITDIVMPGMDGVELMKRARAEGCRSSFVILTCMSEFEYARQAVECGAAAYMLKLSMNVQSLGETLEKVKNELLKEVHIRSHASLPAYQNLYRSIWRSIHDGTFGEQMRQIPFAGTNEELTSVWIGSFFHGRARFFLEEFHKLKLVQPGSRSAIHTFSHSGQTTVFVWNPVSAWSPDGSRQPPFPAAVSSVVSAERLAEVWRDLLHSLDLAWYDGRCDWLPVLENETTATVAIGWKTEREWIRCFEARRLDDFRGQLLAGWKAMEESRLPMPVVKETAQRIDRILSRIAGCTSDQDSLIGCTRHVELGERLGSLAERYAADWMEASAPVSGHPEIDKALGFIGKHYDRDISLKEIAALVAMDETYFSGLFKRKTGVTLIRYIQNVRVRQAKNLLAQTDLPVAEVGERVGFPNANYFIKIFKRWTGMTPSEYRMQSN